MAVSRNESARKGPPYSGPYMVGMVVRVDLNNIVGRNGNHTKEAQIIGLHGGSNHIEIRVDGKSMSVSPTRIIQ